MEKYHDIGGKLSHRKGAPNDKEFETFPHSSTANELMSRLRATASAFPPRRQRNAPNGTSRADMERPDLLSKSYLACLLEAKCLS
jgi:hypothetical protein